MELYRHAAKRTIIDRTVLSSSVARHQLEDLSEQLDQQLQPTLRAGLEHLIRFNFSYESHLHSRIRGVMNPLDLLARFEGCDDPVTSLTPNTRDPKQAAQIVHDGLQVRYEQVVYAVRKQLLLVRSDALRATFAVVEEVRDQLGRARHSEEEWNAFLYPRRGEIWPADFSRLAQLSKTRAEWQEALTDCERLGQQLAAGI